MDTAKTRISLLEIVGALQNLQMQVDILQVQNATVQTQAISPVTPSPQESKIPLLDKFGSDHSQFHSFMNQCQFLFLLCPQSSYTDQFQVGHIISQLTGEELAGASLLLENCSLS
ncbi:hypothetical protein KIL84_018086 [Mauremys mutica]|uniref:Uncharacterized protein n=1 Tax=Mauremys mutica TaxID=74926 RepID=A0A9D4B242_9SAUR|nr:hypothetical protein KIL84_018086 [Mauremys mutica]